MNYREINKESRVFLSDSQLKEYEAFLKRLKEHIKEHPETRHELDDEPF